MFSTIDHFAASQSMLSCLESAGVLHDGANMSNHLPIYSEFDIGVLNLQMEQQKSDRKVSWCKADSHAKENFNKLDYRSNHKRRHPW